jgi:hypothetical protein
MPVTRFAAVLAALLLVGCGAGTLLTTAPSTASPTAASASLSLVTLEPTSTVEPTPTLEPTPTVEPTPSPTPVVPFPDVTFTPAPTDDELAAVCDGKPIPEAAKYAGTVHPLVVVYAGMILTDFAINEEWASGYGWPGPIQLVVCVAFSDAEEVGRCGTYKRQSDGKVGDVYRYRYTQIVRVVVARTGKTLQSKTYYGSIPPCTASLVAFGAEPPWVILGDDVAATAAINKYATAVSTQKVQ